MGKSWKRMQILKKRKKSQQVIEDNTLSEELKSPAVKENNKEEVPVSITVEPPKKVIKEEKKVKKTNRKVSPRKSPTKKVKK